MSHRSITNRTAAELDDANNDLTYVIRQEETFEEGVKRILDEQTTNVIHHLTQQPDIHKGIHDARRCLKIIRAVWRLIREDLDPEDFKRKNEFYRDAGRELSELRDLTALLEALDMMQKKNPKMRRWVSAQTFRRALEARRDEFQHKNAPDQDILLLRETATFLSTHRRQINDFQLSADFIQSVLTSIHKVYGRGYKVYRKCVEEQDPHDMHEWRKRVKYLRYHLHILRNVWPAVFTAFESELHQLSDYLGDFNNLSVMKEHLGDPEYQLKAAYQERLMAEVLLNQEKLAENALHLGRRLYAEKPEAYVQRMEEYVADRKILR